jgi:hypothetical protein
MPLKQIRLEMQPGKRIGKRENIFTIFVGDREEHILSAPNRPEFEKWTNILKEFIKKAKSDAKQFAIKN